MIIPALTKRNFIVYFFSTANRLMAKRNISAYSSDIAVVDAEKELPVKIAQTYSRASVRPI